jgi:hypothetical protein
MAAPLPSTWSVPETLQRRVGTGPGKQRLIAEDGHILIVLHALPNADDPTKRDARYFWRDRTGSWRSSHAPADPTIGPLRNHVETFHQTAESFEERIEQADSADDWFGLLHDLAPFARTARNMARVLQELREQLGPDTDVIAVRDRAVDVERAADLVHTWAAQGLEYTIARSNEEQARLSDYISRASHRLNLLAAFTLPLTAFGSLLGMNLESGIERALTPWLFWGAAAFCVLLGLAVRASLPSPPERLIQQTPRTRKSKDRTSKVAPKR